MTRNIIAILRGITPAEVEAIAAVLIEAGIIKLEIPLNSLRAFESVAKLINRYGQSVVIGAGTVLHLEEVKKLGDMGARMIVSPNCSPEIIGATRARGMMSYPGVMTPTECFQALRAGASGLKIFPGEIIGPVGLKALRAVLPAQIDCFAVGGVNADTFAVWKNACATGFGIGSALYRIGDKPDTVFAKAAEIIRRYDEVMT